MFLDLPADVPITQNILHLALYLFTLTQYSPGEGGHMWNKVDLWKDFTIIVKLEEWLDQEEPIRDLEHDCWDQQPRKGQIRVYANEILYLNYIYLSRQRLMAANPPPFFHFIHVIMLSGFENWHNSIQVYYANK